MGVMCLVGTSWSLVKGPCAGRGQKQGSELGGTPVWTRGGHCGCSERWSASAQSQGP